MKYTPWKFNAFARRPDVGSRWYYGNFTLGLAFDCHPRFWNLILCLGLVEIGIGGTREAEAEYRVGGDL